MARRTACSRFEAPTWRSPARSNAGRGPPRRPASPRRRTPSRPTRTPPRTPRADRSWTSATPRATP
eukprot:30957-Pelagococcus_subviridis.AAC.64